MEDELLLMHYDDKINDEDFFILHDANRHGHLHGGLPYYKYECFNLEGLGAQMLSVLGRCAFISSSFHHDGPILRSSCQSRSSSPLAFGTKLLLSKVHNFSFKVSRCSEFI